MKVKSCSKQLNLVKTVNDGVIGNNKTRKIIAESPTGMFTITSGTGDYFVSLTDLRVTSHQFCCIITQTYNLLKIIICNLYRVAHKKLTSL
jgi:hypothetical protein